MAEGDDECNVTDLQRVLLNSEPADATRAFIRERDDERLTRDLIQNLDWDCGQAGLNNLAGRFRARVADLCADELGIPLEEGPRVAPHLF